MVIFLKFMKFPRNSQKFEIKWTFGCGFDSLRYMRKFSKWQDKKILVKYFISNHQKFSFWNHQEIKTYQNGQKWPIKMAIIAENGRWKVTGKWRLTGQKWMEKALVKSDWIKRFTIDQKWLKRVKIWVKVTDKKTDWKWSRKRRPIKIDRKSRSKYRSKMTQNDWP